VCKGHGEVFAKKLNAIEVRNYEVGAEAKA